jgi:hypothetical protein
MFDFEVQRCSRHCAKTERTLQPGETYYTVLMVEGADIVRYDYSPEAWDGPPDKALGWWKSQIPTKDSKRLHWAPNDVMLDMFEQLEEESDQQDMRFVLALLLVRRRVFRLEETQIDEQNREQMVLFCPRRETTYEVLSVVPTKERQQEIQEELAKLLVGGTDEATKSG